MKETKKRILIIVLGILIAIGIIVGTSYAWWIARAEQKEVNTINSACLQVELKDETRAIQLEKAYPLTEEEAKGLEPYTFTIKNTCKTSIVYDVNLEILETSNRLASEYIATSFNGNAKRILNEYPSTSPSLDNGVESHVIYSGSLKGYESVNYSIKLWMDEHVTINDDAMNKRFKSKIVVNASINQVAEVYKEEILNGADPVLGDKLIPVEIEETGIVIKANINDAWYSYGEKKWANAVILTGEDTYNAGDEIPESAIESYFVWIPKYSYQLWDLGTYSSLTELDESKPHVIPIKFGLENTSDKKEGECTTPMTSGSSGNCKIGDYMTPPAFITMETNGLWIGKFETGYKGATSTARAQVNANDASKVQIKPNVYSWRNIQVSNAFYTSYNYKRELDSHMMKNTEWASVAYLQHSAYGSATSVRINNNIALITGYAAVSEPACGYTGDNRACNIQESTSLGVDGTNTINYKNPVSQVASTTGNYSGIYDMSGGAWEYVMGVRGSITAGSEGFSSTNAPDAKYYDVYNGNSTQTTFQYRILGDATAEFGPFKNGTYNGQTFPTSSWYSDEGGFVNSSNPWFRRGGYCNNGFYTGTFDFYPYTGIAYIAFSFRVVLAI